MKALILIAALNLLTIPSTAIDLLQGSGCDSTSETSGKDCERAIDGDQGKEF